eukprot:ctg_1811.g618
MCATRHPQHPLSALHRQPAPQQHRSSRRPVAAKGATDGKRESERETGDAASSVRLAARATMVTVNVKWNRQVYAVDVDEEDSPEVFMSQLFSCTNVPPTRQTVIGFAGGKLRHDQVRGWRELGLRDGMTVLMLGTPEAGVAGADASRRVRDDLDGQEAGVDAEDASAGRGWRRQGLVNTGNTCYMNATVQCLAQVPELVQRSLRLTAERGGHLSGERRRATGGVGVAGAAARLPHQPRGESPARGRARRPRREHSAPLGRAGAGGDLETHVPHSATAAIPEHPLCALLLEAVEKVKAKILRKVTFPKRLDVYEFCTEELQAELKRERTAREARPADHTEEEAATGDVRTGMYELCAVLTHQAARPKLGTMSPG